MAEATDGFPQYRKDIQYSDESSLNTLELCIPRPTDINRKQLWVVYVHGGAWRDPAIDASSFDKTIQILLQHQIVSDIAGFASINYRLSPYPSHPTDPSNPSDPARNAKHPNHINDVLAALLHLQETFRFNDRYILIGHSCGATIALQVAMKRYWGTQYESTFALELNVVPPVAIVGVEGIYDIPALVQSHADQPVYKDFVTGAYTGDETTWATVSPANHTDYSETWPDGKLVLLAHSTDDELVELSQADAQLKQLLSQGWAQAVQGGKPTAQILHLTGSHDEAWQDGRELARAVEVAVKIVT